MTKEAIKILKDQLETQYNFADVLSKGKGGSKHAAGLRHGLKLALASLENVERNF